MPAVALRHQMNPMHARFEGAHHARGRLVEHAVGHMVKEATLELEVDNEVHNSRVARRGERPSVCQVLQRPAFRSAHQHLPWSIQRDPAGKAFLERAEPDLEFGDDFLRIVAANSRAGAPRHERGIVPYVGHHREKLVGRLGKRLSLLVTRHVLSFYSGVRHGAPGQRELRFALRGQRRLLDPSSLSPGWKASGMPTAIIRHPRFDAT